MSERPGNQPPAGLEISQRLLDDTLVIEVAGDIDLDTAASVDATLERAAGRPCVLDLTRVTFLGSAGLTALLEASRDAEARHEPLRIVVDANRLVIRPIEITGLDTVLRLYHSVDDALKPR